MRELHCSRKNRNGLLDIFETQKFEIMHELDGVAARCDDFHCANLLRLKDDFRRRHVRKPKCPCEKHAIIHKKEQIRALKKDLRDLRQLQDYVTYVDKSVSRARAARDPGYAFLKRFCYVHSDT